MKDVALTLVSLMVLYFVVITTLADLGVNQLAFAAVPIGPMHTQLTISKRVFS